MTALNLSVFAVGSSTGHPPRRVNAVERAGVTCDFLSSIPEIPGSWPSKWRKMMTEVERRSSRNTVCHLHGVYGYLPALAALSTNLPLVATPMGGDIYYREQLPTNRCLETLVHWTLRSAEVVTAKSDAMAARLMELGVNEASILPINWGVDTDTFSPGTGSVLRQQLGISDGSTTILSPRTMEPLYRIDLVLEAFSRMTHPAHLVVVDSPVGSDFYSTECHQLAQQLSIADRVTFIRPVSFESMPDLYRMADVMISVPDSDGVPQSAYESIACGTPVLLGDLPGYRDVFIHDHNAIISPREPAALGKALDLLLRNTDRYQKLSDSGRQYVVEHASLQANVERLLEVYDRLASAPRRPPPPLLPKMAFYAEPIERKLRGSKATDDRTTAHYQ